MKKHVAETFQSRRSTLVEVRLRLSHRRRNHEGRLSAHLEDASRRDYAGGLVYIASGTKGKEP